MIAREDIQREKKLTRAKNAKTRQEGKVKEAEWRQERKLHRRCKWTWPWGHVYEKSMFGSRGKVCMVCGYDRGSFDGEMGY